MEGCFWFFTDSAKSGDSAAPTCGTSHHGHQRKTWHKNLRAIVGYFIHSWYQKCITLRCLCSQQPPPIFPPHICHVNWVRERGGLGDGSRVVVSRSYQAPQADKFKGLKSGCSYIIYRLICLFSYSCTINNILTYQWCLNIPCAGLLNLREVGALLFPYWQVITRIAVLNEMVKTAISETDILPYCCCQRVKCDYLPADICFVCVCLCVCGKGGLCCLMLAEPIAQKTWVRLIILSLPPTLNVYSMCLVTSKLSPDWIRSSAPSLPRPAALVLLL